MIVSLANEGLTLPIFFADFVCTGDIVGLGVPLAVFGEPW